MRLALLAVPLLIAAFPAAAAPGDELFARREATGPAVRYASTVNLAYDQLTAGREPQALELLQGADRLHLHEAANYALLPQIAWLQARTGKVDEARETVKLARLAVALEAGSARCVDTTLEAKTYSAEIREAAAKRYCGAAYGQLKPDELYKRKLAAVEARLR